MNAPEPADWIDLPDMPVEAAEALCLWIEHCRRLQEQEEAAASEPEASERPDEQQAA